MAGPQTDSDLIKNYAGRHYVGPGHDSDTAYLDIELLGHNLPERTVNSFLDQIIQAVKNKGIDVRVGNPGREAWVRTDKNGTMGYEGDDTIEFLARSKISSLTRNFNKHPLTDEEMAFAAEENGFVRNHVVGLVLNTNGKPMEDVLKQADDAYRSIVYSSIQPSIRPAR